MTNKQCFLIFFISTNKMKVINTSRPIVFFNTIYIGIVFIIYVCLHFLVTKVNLYNRNTALDTITHSFLTMMYAKLIL